MKNMVSGLGQLGIACRSTQTFFCVVKYGAPAGKTCSHCSLSARQNITSSTKTTWVQEKIKFFIFCVQPAPETKIFYNEQKFIYLCTVKQRDSKKIEQIFSATLKLVVKSGVAGITMRQIAKEASLATGTLYIYFKDKEELINQLYVSCRASAVNAYFKGYSNETAFKKGFKIIWGNILQHRMENFDEAVFMEQCYHSPFISESTKELNRQQLQPLYKLMDRGKEEKILKGLDTIMLLIFMIGSITEVIKYVNYHKKKITADMIAAAFSICWDGLKN